MMFVLKNTITVPRGLVGVVVMGQYQFLVDKIFYGVVFLAYIIGNIDNICDTGSLICMFYCRNALYCKVRSCDCMSFVCPSVCDVGGSPC